MIDRRGLICRSSLAVAGSVLAAAGHPVTSQDERSPERPLPPLFDEIEKRTFRFFWDVVNRRNGLIPDRWPTPSFCSIAGVGFALTCYPIGVERGWCTRAAARDLTLTTLRFFWHARQGDAAGGTAGQRGFFYHFLDMRTGHRFRDVELSTVDSAILFLGMLFAGAYFDGPGAKEREIRHLAEAIYARADWEWFRNGRPTLPMGWHPGSGFIDRSWAGYNEGMMVVLLALGAPVHRAPLESWQHWTEPYPAFWRGEGDSRHLAFAPLFGHQYSHLWIDFRGIRDAPMREAGFDYFENSRRATYANRAYCMANPMGWAGYSPEIWGLTACDGPGYFVQDYKGHRRRFYAYAARGPAGEPDGRDDGTLAPTAALGALPFAPEIVIPCAEALHREYGSRIFSRYGFLDAFNPSFTWDTLQVERGTVDPQGGWVDSDYLAIDQGAILAMAANHRSDFIWRHMRRVPAIRRGLLRAGFQGGWLSA